MSAPSADLLMAISGLPVDQRQSIIAAASAMATSAPAPGPSQREIQADNRDLARTLHKILKPQTPPTYDGAIDADECLNFIENQEEYFQVVKLAESDWVKYTALNLVKDGKSWWRACGLDTTTEWAEFRQVFLDYHTPNDAVTAARSMLQNIRQGNRSVALYAHEFRGLLRRVPSLDQETALDWFLDGLHHETGIMVRLHYPADLNAAIKDATFVHSVYCPSSTKQPQQSKQTKPSDPNAMDVDALQIAVNNLTAEVNSLRRGNGYNSMTRPPRLTPDEKARLIATNGCFRCRKIGHMASHCRTFPNQQQQPRQFNKIEVATVPAPQQAALQNQSGKANSN